MLIFYSITIKNLFHYLKIKIQRIYALFSNRLPKFRVFYNKSGIFDFQYIENNMIIFI